MTENIFRGALVQLTALRKDDASTMAGWTNDSEFLRLADSRPAYPRDEAAAVERMEEQRKASDAFHFGIRLVDTEELIGNVGIEGIEWPHGTAWISIGIGDRTRWGKGYGYEAMQLVLDYSFRELNLHRVQVTVFGYNERAVALYEKLGFRREGVWREWGQRDGMRFDMILYGLLGSEWRSRQAG